MEKGEFVELYIGPFEELPLFEVSGTVVQRTNQHKNVLLGVEFGELSDRATQKLGQYMRHLLLNHWEA